jgi:hypothetical protein
VTVRKGFAIEVDEWREHGVWVKRQNLVWKRIEFLKNALVKVPTKGGVYAICLTSRRYISNKSPWDCWSMPMYIGRTGNLRNRFSNHVKGDYPATRELALRFSGLDFWYSIVEDAELQGRLEASLISLFGPPANRVQPAFLPIIATLGPAIEISLPSEEVHSAPSSRED